MTRKHTFLHELQLALNLPKSSPAIDVVKTRIQINPAYKQFNLLSGARHVIATEGPSGLLTGFGPTAVGYLVQGGAKFAGYEFWKKQFTQIAGDQETAVRYRTAIYLGASSVAECVSRVSLELPPPCGAWCCFA